MSKIVSPFPPPYMLGGGLTGELTVKARIPAAAQWWRIRLRPNDDGNLIIISTDGNLETPESYTWISWEFFDGETAVLDGGLDKTNIYGACSFFPDEYLDILCIDQPTPSPRWEPLTDVGEHQHPNDRRKP